MGSSEEELKAESPLGVSEEEVFLFILRRKKEKEITIESINRKEMQSSLFESRRSQ